jgi:hypothetical protein
MTRCVGNGPLANFLVLNLFMSALLEEMMAMPLREYGKLNSEPRLKPSCAWWSRKLF